MSSLRKRDYKSIELKIILFPYQAGSSHCLTLRNLNIPLNQNIESQKDDKFRPLITSDNKL